MKFKSLVIATMDLLIYLSFVIVGIFVAFLALSGNIIPALITAVVGWVVCTLFSALWIVLSSINGHLETIANRESFGNENSRK